jgi:putative membrane-bound dehydrogenase-like protein
MIKTVVVPGRRWREWLVVLFSFMFAACEHPETLPPYEPEEALATFRLPAGFRIELVAAEPLIADPVEIAFDADGRMYVAEMEDYPAEGYPGGRIMLLEDMDGDGHYESGTAFAENLPYVNGVMPWREGVLVTSAPDILFLKDTTGDGKADIRHVVLTGFALTNPQLRMSSLRYGPDNWIYGAYSRSGGQRGYPEFTNHGLPLRFPGNPLADSADIYPGTDFRFRPETFEVEPSGGMSQFGLSFDAAGNRFTVWNNIHLRHVVMDARYLTKNPYLHVSSVMEHVSDHGDAATVYSRARNRLDLHESEIGHFTSACGHSIYTGGLFENEYAEAAFVCEPVSNLLHADILTKKGATFSAARAKEGDEFLTSTDSWFRPVNTTVGPDGGLYVVDFYRKLVEHPAWIALADEKGIYTHAGVLQESDFLEGNDRGRIWRIVPEDFKNNARATIKLGKANTETLVAALAHPNRWHRSTAQRLLVERHDTSAVPALTRLLQQNPSPEGDIHALWTLEGLHALQDSLVLKALAHENASVRRQALLLAEARPAKNEIQNKLLQMVADPDDGVKFQLALTMATFSPKKSFEPLQQLAREHSGDEWFRTAVLLSASQNAMKWFESVNSFDGAPEKSKFLEKIAQVTGAKQSSKEVSGLISFVEQHADPSVQLAALAGLSGGLRQGTRQLALSGRAQDDLFKLISSPATQVKNRALDVAEKISLHTTERFRQAISQARSTVLNENASLEIRSHAARVLGLAGKGVETKFFARLLEPKQPVEVQLSAATVLASRNDPPAMNALLTRWQSYTPEIRKVVERGFTGSSSRLSFLVGALERKELDASWLSPALRARLAQHPDKNIRQRADKFLATLPGGKRDEVVTAYYEATTLPGDAAKGKAVFTVVCSSCHQIGKIGLPFGPDLLSVTNQTRINLLTMILDPNNNIAPGYDGYLVETTDGRTFAGILGSESSGNVTLRTTGGQEEVISRDHIKTVRPLSSSLMPDGLEANLSKQDLADLLEYLKKGEQLTLIERSID